MPARLQTASARKQVFEAVTWRVLIRDWPNSQETLPRTLGRSALQTRSCLSELRADPGSGTGMECHLPRALLGTQLSCHLSHEASLQIEWTQFVTPTYLAMAHLCNSVHMEGRQISSRILEPGCRKPRWSWRLPRRVLQWLTPLRRHLASLT